MNAHRLTLTTLGAWLCALVGVLAFAGAPARAETLHRYESQITEVPAGSGVEVPGHLREANGMTVYEKNLYVGEIDGQVASGLRLDEFGPAASGLPGFVSQLPQSSLMGLEGGGRGVAFGTSTGETEMYIGTPKGVDVFGVGLCGTLQCASFQEKWTGADTPGGSFGEVRDLAVDNSASAGDWARGDVFVVDNGGSGHNVVDVFKPEAKGKEKYVAQITGTSPSTPFRFPEYVAVSGFNGDVVVDDEAGSGAVDVFKPEEVGGKGTYSFVSELAPPGGSFTASNGAVAVTVDGGNGEIYVATSTAVYEFSPEGVFLGEFTGAETPEPKWSYYTQYPDSIAVDPISHRVFVDVVNNEGTHTAVVDVFGGDLVIPGVSTGSVSGVEVDSATHLWGTGLAGTVSADGGAATCWFVYGTSRAFGDRQPCAGAGESSEDPVPSGGGSAEAPVSVHASLSGLEPDTTYYYRLQAENTNGTQTGQESQDQSFTTPGPGFQGESVSEVSSSSARLHATIDPDNERTSYRFEYDTRAYAQGESAHGTSAPLTNVPVGAGAEGVEVDQHVLGLLADTEYHYRVVASSEISLGRFEEFDGEDQTFVTQRAGAPLVLPDGRAWEQVSPVDKRGALISPISGGEGPSQASVGGGAFTYQMTASPELQPQGYASSVQLLASRGADGGWSDVVISMPHSAPTGVGAGTGGEYRFFSEDLSVAVAEPLGAFSQPESEIGGKSVVEAFPKATERTPYLRHDSTCQTVPATCYEPLVTGAEGYADVAEDAEFGGNPEFPFGDANFVAGTPDASHIVLDSRVALTAEAAPKGGLYEFSAAKPATERLQLVSVLPEGEVEPANEGVVLGGTNPSELLVARHAISNDGSRIFFSTGGKHQLYMRDTVKGETLRLDVPEDGVGANEGDAVFQTASADGSKVFFTDERPLVKGAGSTGEVGDLYECQVTEVVEAGESKLKCALSDLTPVPLAGKPGAGEVANVQGAVLGASEDGNYIYFVADGVQAEGASPGDCKEGGEPSGVTCNLYVWHEGVTSFIATLSGDDSPDWNVGPTDMTSRVSPNGEWLAFMSDQSLTGYNNHDAVSGMPDEEVYLYDAVTGKLVCASCDPTGARPDGVEYNKLNGGLVGGNREWPQGQWLAANVPSWTRYNLLDAVYQSRYLSNEGRLFFNSSDALVPQDINGNEDVYEYEPPGVGSCTTTTTTFSTRSDGCVGLISSGVAHGESAFLDASESGGDVFFLTSEKLVPQDTDSSLDVYDAHECTTAAPCPAAPAAQPAECVSAASCRAAPLTQPAIYGAPSSATFSGAGNAAPPPAPAVKKAVKAKPQTRAQKLAEALKACRKHKSKGSKRTGCEAKARKTYRPAKKTKTR